MKARCSLLLFLAVLLCSLNSQSSYAQETPAYVKASFKMPKHPRLLMQKGQEKGIQKNLDCDSVWMLVHQELIRKADEISQPPYSLLERQMEGKRLLGISREALKRIFLCSYAYRMTHQQKYLDYCRAEMLNVCQFTDWNPSHYLDVAEMTLAVAIGYDWLYNELPAPERQSIEQGILKLGLEPSYDDSKNLWWINGDNNWNQVCHAGMMYGAIAIWEKDRQLGADIVNRAILNLPKAMIGYAPQGVYPEGTGYWDYGTSFNVLALEALEQIFHSDFGLKTTPGFLQTGQYITHLTTPSLASFCYSDNGNTMHSMPTALWFYRQTGDESILYNQKRIMHRRNPQDMTIDRLAPTAILWGHDLHFSQMEEPKSLAWTGDGINPVFVTRSGWGYEDAFLGMKCGKPASNHAHMDEGSFIYESHGVKWALDLGGENYNNLEQAGLDIWNAQQQSDRWTIYRYNNFAHNTLTFNRQLQTTGGKVEFSDRKVDFPGQATADLTPVYQGQVKEVVRTCSLSGVDDVTIHDHIVTLDHPTEVTWTLITEAKAQVQPDNTLLLQKGKCQLAIRMTGIQGGQWHIQDATPYRRVENPNKGITRVTFTTTLPANKATDLKALFSAFS